MRLVARLIDRGDEAYWPILERLESERDHYISRRERLKTYLRPRPTRSPLEDSIRSDTRAGNKSE